MMDKKEGSFLKKLKKAKPNSIIKLTARDRADNWWNYENTIDKRREDSVNFLFLFLGLILGVTGGYISTQVYDFSKDILLKEQGKAAFIIFSSIIWLIFGIVITIFILKIINNKKQISELKNEQEKFAKIKSIQIGEIYTPEYLENFNLKINNKIKEEILQEINNSSFGIWKFARETNISLESIQRNLNELIKEDTVEKKGFLFWKKYKLKQTSKKQEGVKE